MENAEVAAIPEALAPAELFRALADDTRLRALVLMAVEGELCVCELTCALGVSQPKMSRHLAVLRDAGLVADRRERVWIHYRVAKSMPDWAREALAAVVRGNTDTPPFRDDRAQLARMSDRPGQCREN